MTAFCSHWVARGCLAIVVVVVGLLGTGCGSNDDSTAGSSSATSSTTAAETPPGLARAQEMVQKSAAAPAEPVITSPLSKKPKTGVKVDYLQCGLPICKLLGDSAAEAAKSLGWTLTRIDAGLSPETFGAAYGKAVQDKPDAVLGAPVPKVAYAKALAVFKQAGIPYVEIGDASPLGDGIVGAAPGRAAFKQEGGLMAAFVVADSKAKANTVLFVDGQFSVLKLAGDSFTSAYKTMCPECKLDEQQYSSAGIGKAVPGQVVSYVQSHPDVDYVVFSLGSATAGVPAALKDAGLAGRVKIVSRGGDQLNFASIVNDDVEVATVGESVQDNGYRAIDIIARALNADPLKCCRDQPVVTQLLTKDNITDPGKPFTGGDIAAHYRKLWGVQ
jgi:ABC-type sugar transport system substrate-binding protein